MTEDDLCTDICVQTSDIGLRPVSVQSASSSLRCRSAHYTASPTSCRATTRRTFATRTALSRAHTSAKAAELQ